MSGISGGPDVLTDALARAIGYRFKDPALLQRALTHPSFSHELPDAADPESGHYEALEFLGDAVLGYVIAEMIYRQGADRSEGGMSRLRASLVNARSLADRARELGFARHVRLGRSERASAQKVKPSILADTFESVLGAILLDGGIVPARGFVRRQFGRDIREAPAGEPQPGDFKTRLQEHVQAGGGPPPDYRIVSETGPPHRRYFEVEVRLPGGDAFSGSGWSRKKAEQDAAVSALVSIGVIAPAVDPSGTSE